MSNWIHDYDFLFATPINSLNSGNCRRNPLLRGMLLLLDKTLIPFLVILKCPLLVHPRVVIDIAKRIRSFLIEISKQTQSYKGRESKQSKLYDYLTSAEYYRDVKEILETKKKIDELQRKEEEYHKTTWNRRKEFVEKWFEINKKNEAAVSDITQKEPSSEILTASKEDQFNRSF